MKRLKSQCLCLVLGLAVLSFKLPAKTDDFTGYAYKDGTRQLLYKEESAETFVDQRPDSKGTNLVVRLVYPQEGP